MSWNDVNFNNLTVKFNKAMKKTLKENKDGSPKTVHGYSWSHLTGVQNIFNKYATKIDLYKKFEPIIEHTNIKTIKLEYNGYGDDGCLESLELRDKNGEEIEPSHMLRHFYMHINHENVLKEKITPSNVFDYSLWESDQYTRELRKYMEDRKQYLKDMKPEEFANMDLEDWSNGLIQSLLNMGWSLHTIDNCNNGQRFITLKRKQSYNNHDTFTHFDTRILELMYPKVHKDIWEEIDEAFYSMLQPGWQNNNGSQNYFLVEIDNNKVTLDINEETNVTIQESERTRVVLDESLNKRFQGFIKDIFPKKKSWEDIQLDISLKKDQSTIKQLHDFVKDMLNEKVERSTVECE